MDITRDGLQEIIYDPTVVQSKILTELETATNGDYVISDPTSPFVMLLECAAATAAAATIEGRSIIRKKYPDLATSPEDLYHHITDNQLANMFAVPSVAYIVFYVNVVDLRSNGYRPDGAGYAEIVIPIGTEVVILNTELTLLNDIVVRLYDNGSIFVEQQSNSSDIAINDIGIIPATTISDKDGVAWIIFETRIKQVKRSLVNTTASSTEGFKETLVITDEYYFSKVSYNNSTTNGEYVSLAKAHNDEYIDPSVPTTYINIADKNIIYTIPDVYIINNDIGGNILIEVYETKGELYLPINKYTPVDFSVTLGDTGKSTSASAATNVAIIANSRYVINGGSDGMTLNELRDSIIYNTTGDIDLPITNYQLERGTTVLGFEIYKALDVLTERLYIASKNLPDIESSLILAKQDLLFNTIGVELSNIEDHYNIIVNTNNFVIRSNTVFKEVNGIISLVSESEVNAINAMTNIEKIDYLKSNKYFYNPYYYIVNLEDGYSSSSVYNLDNPVIDNLRIIGKNTNITQRVNIDSYAAIKTNSGYKLYFTLLSNNEFSDINKNLITVQLAIPIKDGGVNVYFNANYDPITGYYTFDIDSDLSIGSDEYMEISNGASNVVHKYIGLVVTGTIYVFTNDIAVSDPTNYLLSEIYTDGVSGNYTVFSKEQVELTFGNRIDYSWNKLYNTYTDRKYKKYTYNVPLVYEEDDYAIDPDTGSIYTCTVDGNNETQITKTLLHSKGDPVLDSNNEPLYKYKIGDIILDDNNLPIIDVHSGLLRYIDILMLEYEFKLATANSYVNYLSSNLDVINGYLVNDMADINSKLLENTNILFKSYKTASPVTLVINNVYYSAPYLVSPSITLYVTNTTELSIEEIENYRDIVGKIIDSELNNVTIKVSTIKENIIATLGNNIAGIKVTNIDSLNSEIIHIKERANRLVMNKVLDTNKYNELIVRYDLTLTIQYV